MNGTRVPPPEQVTTVFISEDHRKVISKVKEIETKGFGEVRVIIQNGYIHRVCTTADEMMPKKQ